MAELSAQEKVDYIKEALQDLKDNKISFLTFAMIVGDIVAPVPVTQADFDWALKTWREIQAGGTTTRAVDLRDSAPSRELSASDYDALAEANSTPPANH